MADPAFGKLPAMYSGRGTVADNRQMSQDELQQQPGYMNPRQALWGGFMADMANHFMSGRRAGFGNQGANSMFQAIRGNQQLEQQYRDNQWRNLQMQQARAQMTKPVAIGSQGDYAQFNPDTGGYDVNVSSPQGLGVGGDSAKSWAYDTIRSGNYDPDSPQYRTAYEVLYNPTTRIDPVSGQEYTIKPQVPADVVTPPGFNPVDQGQQAGTDGKPPKPPTADEAKAYGFMSKMGPAAQVMTDLEMGGYRPTQLQWQSFKRAPDVAISMFPEDAQRYFRAVDGYVRAKLRRESGAAISEREYEDETRGTILLPGMEGDVIRDVQNERINSVEGVLYGSGYQANNDPQIRAQIDQLKATLKQTGMSEEQASSIATDVAVKAVEDEGSRSAGSRRRRGRRGRKSKRDPTEVIVIEGLD